MAKGDVVLFAKFKERVGDGAINLSTAVMKIALTSDTTGALPGGGAQATDPRYGAGGSQDVSTNEVANGGGYTTGGKIVDGADPWAINGDDVEYTADNPVWLSNFSGDPEDIRYGVVYIDNGGTTDYAVGYVQVYNGTVDVSLVIGDVIVRWDGQATAGVVFKL
jgi:hypothetical protein